MSNAMRAGLVLLGILVLAILLASLRSCESPTDDSPGPIQYENTHPETTTLEGVQYPNEHIQYHSTLPQTGGVKAW